MGQWTLVISGTGAHHNKDNPGDADRMAADFVQQLKKVGQDIRLSTFTYGAMQQCVPPEESTLCNPGELQRAYSR